MDATILEHFNIIREDTNSTRQQFPDSEMLKIYNRARNAVESRIKTLNKKYFYTEWVADLDENQSEYSMPIEENGYPACTEVLQVAIKTSIKEDYVNLGVIDVLYNNDIDALRKNGNGYVVMDNSIFIFPEPKKSVVWGVKIYGIYKLPKLTDQSTAEQIWLTHDMIDLLILEAKAIVYEQKALWNERNIMLTDLENTWNRYRNNFFREKWPYTTKEPNYNHLCQ